MADAVIYILVLVFSVVVHEVAHGWTAWRLGDPTARDAGRLTLNPLPHIDLFGSIIVPAVLVAAGSIPLGWAKPVPVHAGRLNNPRDDHPRVAAAGPVSNFLLALVAAAGLGLVLRFGGVEAWSGGGSGAAGFLAALFRSGIIVNVVLAVFNLLPVPPLDGSWILQRFLPPSLRARYLNLQRYGLLAVLGFMFLARYTGLGSVLRSVIITASEPYFDLAQRVAGL
ncbi:site-2 protease family protein [bacterium]|nr:MAG: site-2 protease family protein [bacterium]